MLTKPIDKPSVLPITVNGLDACYRSQEDPWGTRKIPEKRIRYREFVSLLPRQPVQGAVDLSCGEGDFTFKLAKVAKRVLGVDCSNVVIERARERFSSVSFEVFDIRDLPSDWFAQFELITWLDAIYWLTPSESEQVLRRIAEGTKGQRLTLLVSTRIVPACSSGWYWAGHDFESPGEFLDHIRRVFPNAYSVPVQLHLNLRPLTSMSFPQKVVCVSFKILTKLGGYLLALRLAQAAWKRPLLASQVEPVVVHLATFVQRES